MEIRNITETSPLYTIYNDGNEISYPTWYNLFKQPILSSVEYIVLPTFGVTYPVIMKLPQDYKAVTSILKPIEVDTRDCAFVQPLCVSI